MIKSYPLFLRSSIGSIIGMTLWSTNDRVMYSDIVLEVAMRVYIVDAQIMVQPVYVIIQPERYLAVYGSILVNEQDQFPQ